MSDIKIEAKEIKMVDVELLIPNPKNNNRHPIEQYERLKKIIARQGFRVPIEVSNQSGFIVCGHLRYDVACQLGMKQVPVVYQDFESPALEYAHLTAENEISRWAELDKHLVYEELKNLDLDDIELLGLEDFELEDSEKKEDEKPVELSFEYKLEIDCKTEDAQEYLLNELRDRDYEVRVLL